MHTLRSVRAFTSSCHRCHASDQGRTAALAFETAHVEATPEATLPPETEREPPILAQPLVGTAAAAATSHGSPSTAPRKARDFALPSAHVLPAPFGFGHGMHREVEVRDGKPSRSRDPNCGPRM